MASYKRKYTDTLTGGTRDVNPQWFKMRVNSVANDSDTPSVFAVAAYPVPIQRLPDRSMAQVMEILKVQWNLPGPDPNCIESTIKEGIIWSTLSVRSNATTTGGNTALSDPSLVDCALRSHLSKDPGSMLPVLLPIVGNVDGQPLEAELEFDYSKCSSFVYVLTILFLFGFSSICISQSLR